MTALVKDYCAPSGIADLNVLAHLEEIPRANNPIILEDGLGGCSMAAEFTVFL